MMEQADATLSSQSPDIKKARHRSPVSKPNVDEPTVAPPKTAGTKLAKRKKCQEGEELPVNEAAATVKNLPHAVSVQKGDRQPTEQFMLPRQCHCQCTACSIAPAHQNLMQKTTCCFRPAKLGGTGHPCGHPRGAPLPSADNRTIRIYSDGSGSGNGWLERDAWGGAAALLSGSLLQDQVSARLPGVSVPVLEWFGVLLGLWRAEGKGSADTLLELHIDNMKVVKTLHALWSIAHSKQPQSAMLSPQKVWDRPCVNEAHRLLQAWPGPVRILWLPGAQNKEADAAALQAKQEGSPLEGRPLAILQQVLGWRAAYERAQKDRDSGVSSDKVSAYHLPERYHPQRSAGDDVKVPNAAECLALPQGDSLLAAQWELNSIAEV